jgi:hypothetical protein
VIPAWKLRELIDSNRGARNERGGRKSHDYKDIQIGVALDSANRSILGRKQAATGKDIPIRTKVNFERNFAKITARKGK